MTCIVALEHEGKIYLGSDSFLGDEASKTTIDRPKRFIKGDLVIGDAGDVRTSQLLEHAIKIRKIRKNEDIQSYLVKEVSNKLRKAVEKDGIKLEDHTATFLIVVRGEVYCLQDDFSVVRSKNKYAAIGIGRDYALGALAALDESVPPMDRVKRALKVTAELCPQVCGPFHVIEV